MTQDWSEFRLTELSKSCSNSFSYYRLRLFRLVSLRQSLTSTLSLYEASTEVGHDLDAAWRP